MEQIRLSHLGFSTTLPAQAHHYKPASPFHQDQTWPENKRRPFTFDSRYLLCLNTLKDFGMDLLVALSIIACATYVRKLNNLDFLFPF